MSIGLDEMKTGIQRTGEFHIISKGQFFEDVKTLMGVEPLNEHYDNIVIPTRATSGAAGYDIRTPVRIHLPAGGSITVATGLSVETLPGWMFCVFPRSGLGTKYGVMLANTVGIVDSDYIHADNEGHILLTLKAEKDITFEAGDRVVQGVLIPYGITTSDMASGKRTGGHGSTGKQ